MHFSDQASAFDKLNAIKLAARDAAAHVRVACRDHPAHSNQEKRSCCVTFVRALYAGNYELAVRLRARCDILHGVRTDPNFCMDNGFKRVQEAISEMSRLSVQERIRELKALKAHLPDYCVYKRRLCPDYLYKNV